MGRPFDKHIDTEELNALASPPIERWKGAYGLSPDAIREARRHVAINREVVGRAVLGRVGREHIA